MTASYCPECKTDVNSTNRLFQDECGHKKCRLCVMQEDTRCKTCKENEILTSISVNISNVSVIKFDKSSDVICEDIKSEQINSSVPSKKKITLLNGTDCKKTKRTYKALVIPSHILTVTKSPLLYKCTLCLKNFHSKCNIKYHVYCNGSEKPFSCIECGKSFVTPSSLEVHTRTHSGSKPFSCDICSKSFSVQSKLNRHLKIHSGNFAFICAECGKKFPTNDGLKSHLRFHTREKPYTCDLCNSSFSNKSNLNKHQALHAKEKLYMCEQCGKSFRGKYSLYVHKRRHTAKKNIKCDNCDKAFATNYELRRHKIVHNNSNFCCSICSTKFRRNDNLDRHLKTAHSIIVKEEPNIKSIKTIFPRVQTEITSIQINTITKSNNTKVTSKLNEKISENLDIKEKPNAIKVIRRSNDSIATNSENNQNAVPVINAPIKLAFKTDTFKHNYNIHNRTYLDVSHTNPYDTAKSLNIFQRILPPINTDTSKSTETMLTQTRNVITSVGKVNEKDSLEICKKILAPIDAPIHYETSFENKTHASIKNIKFKLPSTYTNNAVKTSEQIREAHLHEDNNVDKRVINMDNTVDLAGKKYIELKAACLSPSESDKNNEHHSVIVNPHNIQERIVDNAPPFNEMHWRKRTSQFSHPKKYCTM